MDGERSQPTAGNAAKTAPAKVTTRLVLSTVVVALGVVHVAQLFAGEHTIAAVVAYAIVAAWVFGARYQVLRSVRTAVVLMVAISLACVFATLTVQRPQLGGSTDEDYRGTVAYAWAHLLVKASHPIPRSAELSEAQQQHIDELETVFGEEVAAEEQEKADKSALAMVDQAKARELAAAHSGIFAALYRVANGLGFTDAYGAWWFACLFYLLAANLLVGAVTRRKVSVRNLGFHAAHIGLVLVVAGATGSAFVARKGFVALQVGRTVDSYGSRDTGEAVPLGFSLRLDEFETHYHEDLYISSGSPSAPGMGDHHGFGNPSAGMQRTEKLEVGKELRLQDPDDGTTFDITFAEITEAAGTGRVMVAVEPGAEGAVQAVRLGLSERDGDSVWLRSDDPPFIDPMNRYKIRVSEGLPQGEAAASSCADVVGGGSFSVTMAGSTTPMTVRAVPGEVAVLGPLTVGFEQVFPNFRVGVEDVSPSDFPRNPAMRASVRDESGEGGEFLFFSEERLKDFTRLPWEGVEASFDYDYWCTPTGSRIELVVDGDGQAQAHSWLPDGTVIQADTAVGSRLAGVELTLLEALPAGREEWRLITDPPPDATLHTALRLEVSGPGGQEERWLLSDSAQGVTRLAGEGGGEGLLLRLAANQDRPPRDWRSHISVLEEGHVVQSAVVEVNEPLYYGGYSFFQSDADASRPDYSGLQVVRDPAWPLVAAGLWALLLGISWCFYVQPVMDRRKRRARAAAAGGER